MDDRIAAARTLVEQARCTVSFSGAGLSAESGVPTFRDAATGGLWAQHDPMRLASPEGFRADPKLVVEWYAWRRRAIAGAQPNPAHVALAQRTDITHVTQNVDDLLERAGALEEQIVHLHGTIGRDFCFARCGFDEVVDMANPPGLRACPGCGAPVRPGVVWFGEALPGDAWMKAERACGACDLLLVVGTSAAVHPAAGLIGVARSAGAKVIVVNTQPSGASGMADVELIGPAGELLPKVLV
jgi:NAD-dependent deacetylase